MSGIVLIPARGGFFFCLGGGGGVGEWAASSFDGVGLKDEGLEVWGAHGQNLGF